MTERVPSPLSAYGRPNGAESLDNLFIARGQEAPDGDAEALVVGQGWQ